MPQGTKRQKYHDKDKYYKLAKDQGYRSRAAFKLTQINRKYHFLENAKVLIDLCAAPGGWTQVASRTMAKSKGSGGNNIIVAVDILPMRAIPNVITLIGDITTEKCKAQIKAKLQTALADVVLCDGAPNVGASYDRDAYQQNEIALHSLKCATQHLRRNGTFVTKIYRSSDYSAFLWIVKQLFENVQAVKPTASRSQSAEIFLVCTGYLDPTSIDPRMLDPKSVFEQVDGAATGGGDSAQTNGTKGITIFHKKFDEKRRSRQGYDMDTMDATMRNIGFVCEFIESSGTGVNVSKQQEKKDPIQMLSFCTGLSFNCHLCKERDAKKKRNEEVADIPSCNCAFYLNHKFTTSEIKSCVSDLKVLNKSDFKGLLTWRTKMQEALKEENADSDDDEDDEASAASAQEELDSDAEEENIQAEIAQLRHKKFREQKRQKKKERALAAKRRKRAALGMDLNALEVPEAEKTFSLATITNKGTLEAAREVDLNKVTDDEIYPTVDSDEDDGDDENVERNEHGEVIAQGEEDDIDEDTGYSYRLDRELDMAYDRYLKNTKSKGAKSGTKMAKRSKKAQRAKAAEEAQEDQEMMGEDTKAYAKMLQGQKDSDDDDSDNEEGASSSDDDDDGFRSIPMTPEEHAKNVRTKKKKQEKPEEGNPLIHTLPEEPASMKSARWFSNPLFESIGTTASLAAMSGPTGDSSPTDNIDDDASDNHDSDEVEQLSSDDERPTQKNSRKSSKTKGNKKSKEDDDASSKGLNAEEILAMMPKTDKQIRHEKRLKAMERMERKKARRARLAGEPEGGFEVVDKEDLEPDEENKLDNLSEKERKKVMEARELIKAGLGKNNADGESTGFEVVSASDSKKSSLLPVMDSRKYDSENEDYDSDDYAQTLALGTMMLRKSKEKALVDASYNRFAWNDPGELPDWFVDDENKHYRPQLPIPPELLAKMREKFVSLATRPIAKVAEARARKNKRAKLKLSAAKKKAETVANSSEMSEAMKLKAISKAMRGHDSSRPEKTYVVSKKGGGTRGGKGIKLVDKRMKNDKRSMDRATSKRKHGKKGGLTGSKRRRHHK
mmetsp:Transcript_5706/g.8547  ORF Transcript_5706/g.8547 Transcript_5706/m.8547 type:complete len:1066 (-) Transcript_5706:94-3291(-)|eukprot:CAMPEP_0203675328 /NCGR_PEP_ID=MMETSP0090-20130426/19784_1 /ASSEMBLY_ACC=CAM_ASM_001088 /TAXON_ID=426623 /ORGANISM="Chaetoceros affinis, Strain CCMP159" /LENGTH=1065 /DNA_ID=CAMNT_0050541485 /DNA_START=31 /DNA_END=3228 /DNA_ORIENTATION=-